MPLSTQPIANPNGSEPVPLTQEADLYVKVCSLLQTTSDIIYFKDLNSVFTLCSDSHTVSLTGGLDESVIGKSDFDFYDPERAQAFFDDEQEIIRTGEPIIGQVENTARNGKTTWVSSSKFPLRGADGRIIGTYGISRDITDQKRTQQKLGEANAQLVDTSRRAGMAEIATHVIHNVGNVLTSVKVAVSHSSDLCAKFPFEKIERVADLIEKHSADKDFFAEGQEPIEVAGWNQDQLFFVGWSRVWARKYRDAEMMKRLLTDPHSPSEYRANGPVTNIDAFYKAFGLKPGDGLFKPEADRIKIW